MEKSCQSSGDFGVTSNNSSSSNNTIANSSTNSYLKQLNKLSHKISKPPTTATITKKPTFNQTTTYIHHPPPPPPPHQQQQQQQQQPTQSSQQNNSNNDNNNLQQNQPPVYNINKNDFRDVVQKLTGSPAHERISSSTAAPPPIHSPKPPSSRLQRIRPPPLAHVCNRPPPLLNSVARPQHQLPLAANAINQLPSNSSFLHRPPAAPLSPLPPFPAVHAAADSPVSAYMRYLQNSISAPGVASGDPNGRFPWFLPPLAPLASPRWNNPAAPPPKEQTLPPPPPPQLEGLIPSTLTAPPLQFQLPTSPLPFGCLNSPKSPYASLSPSLRLSPSSFPLSPTAVPVLSPRWEGL